MENRLLVFVSSLIGELLDEREVVETAVGAIPLTRAWVFEHTPASAEPVAESYLRKVRECDIFILLVGRDISDPVKEEYHAALDHQKPCLVFLKDVERSAETEAFINEIDVKWAKFSSTDELQQQVREAVTDELIKGYRRYRLNASEVGQLADFMEQLGAMTVVGPDHIQATVADVNGQVAVGKDIIQTGDISSEESALAIGHGAIATLTKYLADLKQPLNAVLTAFLITVLVGETFLFPAINWNPEEIGWTIYSILPVMICVPSFAVPVAVFGLVLSILLRSRRNIALSILVGALGIGLGVLARIIIELGRRIYGG